MTLDNSSQTDEKQLEHIPVKVKVDSTGLPLLPQPSTSPFDPLNYPNWLKYTILGEICMLAFLGTLNVAVINPAVVPLSTEFGIGDVTGTYQTTIAIGAGALGPVFFTPFANVYGRRPVYLLSVLIGFASALGSARSKSYGTLMFARAMNGFGPSAAFGLGAGTVVDVFFMHERGKAMGLFTLMYTNGSHVAPIVGGYIARDLGWRWCFYVSAILNGAMFVICFFFMPETLFDRPEGQVQTTPGPQSEFYEGETQPPFAGEPFKSPPMSLKTYLNRMQIPDPQRPPSRRLKMNQFIIKPFSMLKYPSVIFPALFFAVNYGLASIEPALTLAPLFTELYQFDTVRNGLANGVSLLVGGQVSSFTKMSSSCLILSSSLGELCSSPITDKMMQRARRRALSHGEPASAEIRLQGIWTGAFAVPAGLLIYGFTVRFAGTFVAPCIGMAIACFGAQIITSVVYTYSCSDCYRTRSNDVSLCFNFARQTFGLTLGFYSIPFGERIGFQWSFTVFSVMCMTAFLPVVALMFRGERWREKLGEPL